MKDIILIVLVPVSSASSAQAKSRTANRAYDEGWDRIFGKKEQPKPQHLN